MHFLFKIDGGRGLDALYGPSVVNFMENVKYCQCKVDSRIYAPADMTFPIFKNFLWSIFRYFGSLLLNVLYIVVGIALDGCLSHQWGINLKYGCGRYIKV